MPETFWDHLGELRGRLLKAIVAVAAATTLSFFFVDRFLVWLMRPAPKGMTGLSALKPAVVFLESFKLALLAGLVLALPVVLYQAWAFVRPGLKEKEKRTLHAALWAGTLLFLAGALFAYTFVIPAALQFFWMYAEHLGIVSVWTIDHYLSFVLMILFSFGLAFELPVILVLLVALKVISAKSLEAKRPYIIVALALLAALLTPPDVISQVFLIIPLWLLFEISLFVSKRL